ncbi:MAG: hypothetical protein K8R23_16550 [Chthoniobacter sp.]|nr:hypothetical protein [Chthoniobacter sp.]
MKKLIIIALAALTSFSGALAAQYPIQAARTDLERAHSLVTTMQAGGPGGIGKNKATIPNIIAALSDAELSLDAVKNNKGTNTNVALKFTAAAKTEVNLAKDGKDAHLEAAKKAIEEALERVMQGITVNQRKR